MTEEQLVVRDQQDSIAILTMQYRPYNLLGPKLMSAFRKEISNALEANSRCIVIKSGLRHFSAGADLDIFQERASSTDAVDPGARKTDENAERSAVVEFLRMFELAPVPIVASVHGVCLGGGLELALACDYIIATSSAKIGSVEATLGLHPLMGGIQRQVQRIGAARAKEMSMLARRYDAKTLANWGLINLVVPDDHLESATMTIAQEFANGPTLAHAATKQLAYIAANEGVLAADDAMAECQKPIWSSEDLKIGLESFMKNGPGLAKFKGQ
ncbi:MAG: enoyl-CoA hydratase/isomerase family protein [Methyloligellaceae bacterium]